MNTARNKPTEIPAAVLRDGDMQVSLLGYGAITQGWWYKNRPLILGYDDPTAYLTDRNYVGAIVGRIANRIGGAGFDLDGTHYKLTANEGRNTLHGGPDGLSQQYWHLEKVSPSEAVLEFHSQDGEGGFPGDVRFEVRVKLNCPRLVYSISAWPDRPTPISIAQHNYYTLGSADGVPAYKLKLASDRFLELDDQGIPWGRVAEANKGRLDFTSPRLIETASMDIDHYFLFQEGGHAGDPVAELSAPSGLTLTVFSDQPGAQVYSGAHLSDPFFSRAGLCIEPSGYPNAPNVGTFPSAICGPYSPYSQTLALEISEGQP